MTTIAALGNLQRCKGAIQTQEDQRAAADVQRAEVLAAGRQYGGGRAGPQAAAAFFTLLLDHVCQEQKISFPMALVSIRL